MQPDYWQQRWQDNDIGFNQPGPTPLMLKHWPDLALAPGTQVFVPLAGKAVDMAWFAAHGWPVFGVEVSQQAVEQFFAEQSLVPQVRESRLGRHYVADGIELLCGDAFALDRPALAECSAVFDRAALIALPPEMRQRYVRELQTCLPAGCEGLLITLEYPQHEKDGPPFSVDESEVRALYGADWEIDVLERRDILAAQPSFVAEGVTALDTVVYRLRRRAG